MVSSMFALVLGVVPACGFDISVSGDAVDAPEPDSSPPQPQWAVIAVERTGPELLITLPFDATAGFRTPCAELASPPSRALLGHPNLPYVYTVAEGFQGVSVGCSALTPTTFATIGTKRETQRIVLDPTATVGFFTIDGSGAIGLYRFSVAATGVPTITGSVNGPSISGALALDVTNRELLIAGATVIWSYPLVGANFDLPANGTHTIAVGCTAPVDLVLSGGVLLAFCSDTPNIQRYRRTPFAFDVTVGALGAVSRVVALPNDRAVAARISPPQLAILDLKMGTPTWTDGPVLATPVTAMSVSPDGTTVATARMLDATRSEVALWKISGSTLMPLDTAMVVGKVNAIAITAPGT